jgi:hypothetical protein
MAEEVAAAASYSRPYRTGLPLSQGTIGTSGDLIDSRNGTCKASRRGTKSPPLDGTLQQMHRWLAGLSKYPAQC